MNRPLGSQRLVFVPVAGVLRVPVPVVLKVQMVAMADRLMPADFLCVHVPVIALMRCAVLVVLVHGIGTSAVSFQHRTCRDRR